MHPAIRFDDALEGADHEGKVAKLSSTTIRRCHPCRPPSFILSLSLLLLLSRPRRVVARAPRRPSASPRCCPPLLRSVCFVRTHVNGTARHSFPFSFFASLFPRQCRPGRRDSERARRRSLPRRLPCELDGGSFLSSPCRLRRRKASAALPPEQTESSTRHGAHDAVVVLFACAGREAAPLAIVLSFRSSFPTSAVASARSGSQAAHRDAEHRRRSEAIRSARAGHARRTADWQRTRHGHGPLDTCSAARETTRAHVRRLFVR